MNRIGLPAIALVLIGPAHSAVPILSATSYGTVVFGDRVEAVEVYLKEKALPITDPDEKLCRQIEFKAYPGVYFMIEEGRITRTESSTPIKTSVGYTVGASLGEIKKHVPAAVIEPHHYDAEGHYVTMKNKEATAAIVMEEVKGTITNVRGGLIPSVQYVEGCL